MTKTLEGQKIIQVWQWGPPTQAEATIEDAIALCKQFGLTGLFEKALDGGTWMGNIESQQNNPTALRSVDDARRHADACHAAGLFYGVWTNPLGQEISLEGFLTGQLARATEIDALFLDVEPYAGFWGAWRPAGLALNFMQMVRGAAPNAYIVLQPDPRPARFAELRPTEWMPFVDALSGQHYFGVFGTEPEEEMAAALQLGVEWGKPNYPTLSVSNIGGAEIERAMRYLETVGITGTCLWRMGTANAEHLRAFASFTPPVPPTPEPPNSNAAVLDRLTRAEALIAEAKALLA